SEGSQRLPRVRQAHGAARLLRRFVAGAAAHRGTDSEVPKPPLTRRSRSIPATVVAIALGLGLAACGGGGTGTADTAGAPAFSVPTAPPSGANQTAANNSTTTSTSGTGTTQSGSTSPSSGATTPSSGATGGGGTGGGTGGGGTGGGGGGTGTSGGAGLDSSFCLQNPATC